jgi:hypothetical protein
VQIKLIKNFLIQILLLLGISLVSKYSVPDLSDANWDTVLFLTPIGILKNSLAANPTMRSFYGDISSGQVDFTGVQEIIIAGILLMQIIFFIKLVNLLKLQKMST